MNEGIKGKDLARIISQILPLSNFSEAKKIDISEFLRHIGENYADDAFLTAKDIELALLCGAKDWLHHVQGCSEFSMYPQCSEINKFYFGHDDAQWGKTPTGVDCAKFEAHQLDQACNSLCMLAYHLNLVKFM